VATLGVLMVRVKAWCSFEVVSSVANCVGNCVGFLLQTFSYRKKANFRNKIPGLS